jgi:hypothetical protein
MNKTTITVAAVILAASLAGCAPGGDPTDPATTPTEAPATTPAEPYVSLHAPETTLAGQTMEVVIDSSGHDSETVSLYAFLSDYDEPADCTDTSVRPQQVILLGGPQAVTVTSWGGTSRTDEGDIYFVLSGDGIVTDCGALRTRVLITVAPNVPNSETYGSGSFQPKAVGEEFSYGFSFEMWPTGPSVPASVTWVGPFATAPEAQASPCQTKPIAFVDSVEATLNSPFITSTHVQWTRSVDTPGVYRLLVSVEATPYSTAFASECETALLVTIQP